MHDGLVRDVRAGDAAAFACLLEREVPAVQRAVLAIVGSPDEAQDVIQDASIRAWRLRDGLRDEESWPAWFRRIAVRVAFDHASRRRRIRELGLEAVVEPPTTDGVERSAARIAVAEALRDLSPEDRAILGLRFGADLEVPEVARALDIPLGTAKSRLHRALGRLARAMGESDV